MNNFHVYEAIGRGKYSVSASSLPRLACSHVFWFRFSLSLALDPRGSIRIWLQRERSLIISLFFSGMLCDLVRWGSKTVYKGRKKKTIEYFAVKSVDKSQRSKVLNEVSALLPCVNRGPMIELVGLRVLLA
jgi:hypothetical protein